jgi:hypothetical protein
MACSLVGAKKCALSSPMFRRIAPPSATELQALVHRIAERIGRALQRQGLLIRDCETSYLALDPADDSAMNDLLGHSITYRVAVGPRAGENEICRLTMIAISGDYPKKGANSSGQCHRQRPPKSNTRDRRNYGCTPYTCSQEAQQRKKEE